MEVIGSGYEYGDLRRGFFFELDAPLCGECPPGLEDREDVVVRVPRNAVDYDHILYATVVWEETREFRGCQLNPDHVTAWIRDKIHLDLFGGPYVADFVFDSDCQALLVTHALQQRLLSSEFTGFSISNALPIAVNQSCVERVNIFMLQSRGLDCTRPTINHLPEYNRCPFCGWGPVVCPDCLQVTYSCKNCGREIVAAMEDHGGLEDPRFAKAPRPEEGLIIDGKGWDGNDFINQGEKCIVTRRVVDWLVEAEAVPFIATGCRVDITGMTDLQFEPLFAL